MMDTITAGIPCNLCGHEKASVLSLRSRSGKPLRTVACVRCGLVWSDPRPHDAKLFYEREYRIDYKRTYEPRPKHVLRAGKVALSRLEKIRDCLNGNMRILDVGSGGGEFAYLLQKLGHEVEGVEPNHGYTTYSAREYGLAVTRGLIGESALPDNRYDLITIWHVLEHTEDPGAVLQQLRRALRPGGKLVVEVPNVEATCQSPRNTFHEAHLYNFNAAALHRLARKADLQCSSSQLSPDGGNITCVFLAQQEAIDKDKASLVLAGNHDAVVKIVTAHTSVSHWLSPHPYRRFFNRLTRAAGEWFEARRAGSGRQALDALFANALSSPAPAPALAASHIPWRWIGLAYVLAAALEWLLLDSRYPAAHWGEAQLLMLYAALSSAMIFAVVWYTSRPNTLRQVAKHAVWAAPILALPAYC